MKPPEYRIHSQITPRQIKNLVEHHTTTQNVQQYALRWLAVDPMPQDVADFLILLSTLNIYGKRGYCMLGDTVYKMPETKQSYHKNQHGWRVLTVKYN